MATRRRRPEPVHDWERLNRARHDWEPLRLRPDVEIANSEDEEDEEPFNPDECDPEESAEFFFGTNGIDDDVGRENICQICMHCMLLGC